MVRSALVPRKNTEWRRALVWSWLLCLDLDIFRASLRLPNKYFQKTHNICVPMCYEAERRLHGVLQLPHQGNRGAGTDLCCLVTVMRSKGTTWSCIKGGSGCVLRKWSTPRECWNSRRDSSREPATVQEVFWQYSQKYGLICGGDVRMRSWTWWFWWMSSKLDFSWFWLNWLNCSYCPSSFRALSCNHDWIGKKNMNLD